MNSTQASISSSASVDGIPLAGHEISQVQALPLVPIGLVRLCGLSDAERELHIKDCAWLMEDAMQRYYETGCFSHRGAADRWRLLMEEAIKGRSPEYVAKLEKDRGLA